MALQDFITTANNLGFGKKYNFQVTDITGAPSLVNTFGYQLKKDSNTDYLLYIESLSLPSRKVNTATIPYKAFDFNVPTNVSFPESSRWGVTFFSDDNLLIRTLFENWSKLLYDPVTNSSSTEIYGTELDEEKSPFGSCNLSLVLKNDRDITKKKVTFYGVFPVLVESIEYNIGDNGESVAKLPVTLAFQYFNFE
jgi:hypothetical protein